MLTARGYRLVGFENVLGLALPAPRASTPDGGVEVRPSGEDELDAWLDAVVTGFANPDLQGAPSHESFAPEVPEPDGPEDEWFVYVVTAAGVEALRERATAFDSEQDADECETVPG